jgi:hypothetical protein
MSPSAYWWLALALGLVVAVVAVVLLHTLLRQVWRVERAAGEVWQAGKQVAGNTANLWVLGATVDELDLLAEEAERHRALLRGDTGGESP